MKLIIAEKPSLARSIVSALGGTTKGSGFYTAGEYLVTWAFGHLFSLADVEYYTGGERGGKWSCGFHVARQSYDQGKKTAASANGRRLGEELSKNVSPSMGQNREGATAAILSATKIDATAFTCDAALDLGLLPSAVKGEDGLAAMYGLLMTFMHRGGHALQFNVFNADMLRAAQADPDKYQDLQIRVCGWNVLWNDICKEEQDGFIRQAEALI